MALDLPNLKILGQEAQTRASTRHQKVQWSPASFHARTHIDANLSRADHSSPWFLTRAPPVLWCHDVVTLHTRSNPFVQPTRFEPDRPDLNRLKLKKKREREKEREREKKKLWPSGPLTLTKKVKIFKRGLSHSVFRVHSNSRIRFFVQDSEIMQTVQIPKSWLLHKFRPRVKIFKKDLSCPIFLIDSDFGVYFFIQESEIAQIVWFYSCWRWCELWQRIKMFEQSLSYSDFHIDSNFGIRLFVLDLETTYVTHFSEVLAVSKT